MVGVDDAGGEEGAGVLEPDPADAASSSEEEAGAVVGVDDAGIGGVSEPDPADGTSSSEEEAGAVGGVDDAGGEEGAGAGDEAGVLATRLILTFLVSPLLTEVKGA